MTTTYPIKPALYAITKSTNYLPNVLMQMEAKEAGSITASSSTRTASSARART